MILRRLKVQCLRCFRSPLEIGPFSAGVNIIFAPNESGKSTLIDAVTRALFDRHTVTGDKIETLRPWGTKLAPEVELDFETDGKSYRLLKRFLGDPVAQLSVLHDGTAVLEMDRDHADDFVRDLMVGEAPGRGVSKREHWGIARMLWCLQSGDDALEVSDSVAQQLRQALPGGGVSITSPVVKLLERLDRLYAVHFTDTGRVKKDSPLQCLEQEIARGKERLNTIQADYAAAQQAAENLHGIEYDLIRVREEKGECLQRVARYEEEAGAVRALRARVEALLALVAPHDREYTAIKNDLDACETAARRVKELEERQKETAELLEEAVTDRKAAEQLRLRAQQAADTARQTRAKADAARMRGRKIAEALSLREQIVGLEYQLKAVSVLLEQRQIKEQELHSVPCPSEDELAAARDLQQRISRLQGQRSAVGLLMATVGFTRDTRLEIRKEDGTVEVVAGKAGDTESLLAGATLDLTLPGVLNLRVESGAQEVKTYDAELRQCVEELQALLARYGARDDADLIKKQVAWKALEQEVTRLGREITALLAPFKSAEALRATLADRTKALTVSCHEIGIALDEVPALEPPDEHALQAAYDAALKEEETQHALLDDLQKHYERCRKTEADLVNGKAEALRALEREHSIIHTILSSRGCSNLDALRTAVEASAASLREVRDAYNTAQADLPDPSVDPERLLVTARDALAEMEARISDLRDQRTRAIASIEQAQVEGRYEKLAAAEEELSGLQTEYARVSREARAVALLRTLLNERRRDAVSGQLPGLAEAVSRMMQAIMQRPRSITLTDAFNVARVQEEGVETPYLADALSAGAREQLDLVLRIALGEAYAGEYGRAMLVLDDALLYTDPARHDRIKEILKIAADRLQIFILTSHADRYRGITAPEYQFDLMKLRAQSVARV